MSDSHTYTRTAVFAAVFADGTVGTHCYERWTGEDDEDQDE